MKTANIATAKNQLSRLIDYVKHGETVLILERDKPVARLQPLESVDPALGELHASGLLSPPEGNLDLGRFVSASRPVLDSEGSLASAILAEREEGR